MPMISRMYRFRNQTYCVRGEVVNIFMRDRKVEEILNTTIQWIQTRKMKRFLATSKIYSEEGLLNIRVEKGLTKLNQKLDYPIDGFDLVLDFELRMFTFHFYPSA